MKTLKMAAVLAALGSTFALTSCLDSDSSNVYDLYENIIVKESMGMPYLQGEYTGNIYNPASTSVLSDLLLSDGTYYKRATVGIRLADGQTLSSETSTYTITAITVTTAINYKSFNLQGDTLSTQTPINSLVYSSSKAWARYGYVNVPFTLDASSASLSDFNLYAYEAKDDTLFTRFQFSGKAGSSRISDFISFEMPFSNYAFSQYYNQLQPKNDSIVITVSALGENDATLTSSMKYRYTER
jgi:hypothetical protein